MKKAYIYSLKRDLISFGSAVAAYIASALLVTLIFGLMGDSPEGLSQNQLYLSIKGAEFIFLLLFFIVALTEYRGRLRLMLQMGKSRRSTWLATAASMITHALAVSSLFLFAEWLAGQNVVGFSFQNMFGMLYPGSHWLIRLSLSALLMCFSFLLGMLVNLVYARLEKRGIIILNAGLAVLLLILMSADAYTLNFALTRYAGDAVMWLMMAEAGSVALVTAAVTAVLTAITYLLNRRLPLVKAASL